jgi:multiple sugar transport system ATP-binding protein
MEGVVEVVEPLGAETIIELNCGGARILARLTGSIVPTAGERLCLGAELRRFLYFNKATGERLRQSQV